MKLKLYKARIKLTAYIYREIKISLLKNKIFLEIFFFIGSVLLIIRYDINERLYILYGASFLIPIISLFPVLGIPEIVQIIVFIGLTLIQYDKLGTFYFNFINDRNNDAIAFLFYFSVHKYYNLFFRNKILGNYFIKKTYISPGLLLIIANILVLILYLLFFRLVF